MKKMYKEKYRILILTHYQTGYRWDYSIVNTDTLYYENLPSFEHYPDAEMYIIQHQDKFKGRIVKIEKIYDFTGE